MDSQKPPRRPCFIEEDDGLASVAEMKAAGFSGLNQNISRPQIHYNTIAMQRKNSLRNLSGYNSGYVSSPRSVNATMRFYEEPLQPHFLEACFLCKKQLGCNKDIFMYRGDTPFCSEECRQEQIEIDEAREKTLSLSASVRAMRKKEQRKSNSSPNKNTTDCSYRSSTVAAA